VTSQDISLQLQDREVIRKGLRQLRDDGQVPAVIHDHGKPSLHVMAEYMPLLKTYEQAGKHHPVQLKVGGKQQLAMIKDVDFEPVKHRLRHVVFQAIKQNEKGTAEVPVVLEGDEIPAEKLSLLVLKQLDHVEVEALPRDLPDELRVDATKLENVGDHLTVADLQIPEGVTLLTEPTMQIAIVEMPKDQIAEADAIAAEQAEALGKPEEEEAQAEGEAAPAEDTGEEQA
jgi:large subunit ribosomal protein L25